MNFSIYVMLKPKMSLSESLALSNIAFGCLLLLQSTIYAPRLRGSLYFVSFTISFESMIKMIYPHQTSFVIVDITNQLLIMMKILCQQVRSQELKQLEQ